MADYRQVMDVKRILVLDYNDPDGHLEALRLLGKTKNGMYIYPVMDYFQTIIIILSLTGGQRTGRMDRYLFQDPEFP